MPLWSKRDGLLATLFSKEKDKKQDTKFRYQPSSVAAVPLVAHDTAPRPAPKIPLTSHYTDPAFSSDPHSNLLHFIPSRDSLSPHSANALEHSSQQQRSFDPQPMPEVTVPSQKQAASLLRRKAGLDDQSTPEPDAPPPYDAASIAGSSVMSRPSPARFRSEPVFQSEPVILPPRPASIPSRQNPRSRLNGLDKIDELDETNPVGLPLHHGGPYEGIKKSIQTKTEVPFVPPQIYRAPSNLTFGAPLNLQVGQVLPHNFHPNQVQQSVQPTRNVPVPPRDMYQPIQYMSRPPPQRLPPEFDPYAAIGDQMQQSLRRHNTLPVDNSGAYDGIAADDRNLGHSRHGSDSVLTIPPNMRPGPNLQFPPEISPQPVQNPVEMHSQNPNLMMPYQGQAVRPPGPHQFPLTPSSNDQLSQLPPHLDSQRPPRPPSQRPASLQPSVAPSAGSRNGPGPLHRPKHLVMPAPLQQANSTPQPIAPQFQSFGPPSHQPAPPRRASIQVSQPPPTVAPDSRKMLRKRNSNSGMTPMARQASLPTVSMTAAVSISTNLDYIKSPTSHTVQLPAPAPNSKPTKSKRLSKRRNDM